MLTSILRVPVKNLIKESFDITFMRNEKSCQNINCFYFFSHKNLLKIDSFSISLIKE